jgi:hypothetical protein
LSTAPTPISVHFNYIQRRGGPKVDYRSISPKLGKLKNLFEDTAMNILLCPNIRFKNSIIPPLPIPPSNCNR